MSASDLSDFMSISTNLPLATLEDVARAIVEKKVVWDESKTSMLAEYCTSEFKFNDACYKFEEILEIPDALTLVSGSPDFVQSLIDEHEKELSEVVAKRKYKKAEKISDKIESLKKLLPA